MQSVSLALSSVLTLSYCVYQASLQYIPSYNKNNRIQWLEKQHHQIDMWYGKAIVNNN